MVQHSPPSLLERMLMCCLPVRDRGTISGDLFEEYWQEQVPRVGSLRANIWYVRQGISFLSVRGFEGLPMRAGLAYTSLLTAGIVCWLLTIEQILRHPAYAERMAIAACITLQGLGTLLALMFGVRPISRAIVLLSAVGMVLFGAYSIERILQSQHFEGFVPYRFHIDCAGHDNTCRRSSIALDEDPMTAPDVVIAVAGLRADDIG